MLHPHTQHTPISLDIFTLTSLACPILPSPLDEERIGQKRRKKLDHYTNFFRGGPGGPPGGGGPPPPGGDPGAGMGDGGQGAGKNACSDVVGKGDEGKRESLCVACVALGTCQMCIFLCVCVCSLM